jgi:Domain of unknown function (DUF4440)
MRSKHAVPLVAALALVLAAAPTFSAPQRAAAPAPRLRNPTASARPLVNRFFVLLEHKDAAGLRKFLSPAFQVQRADGSGSGRAAYLANLPTIDSYTLTGLTATQAGGTLVVRYLARVEGLANGKPYTPGPAPRLSVFSWNGTRWQLAAHANFNPLTG